MLCYSFDTSGNISQCLRAKRKSAHGLGWRNVLTPPSSIMSDSEVGGVDEMRISVSGEDDIDTTQEASRGCSNVSPDASGTREWLMQKQLGDGTGTDVRDVRTDVGDVRAGSHTGLWTGTGIAVSLTGAGNPVPFSSTSSSDDHSRRMISHLTSGGTVDSTAECLNLSLEELRSHRLLLGKRVRTGSLSHANGGQEVWKKVRTVSLLHSGPSDLVSGCHADTADDDDDNSEGGDGGDGGDDMDDDMGRDEDENEDIDRDGEVVGEERDGPSPHSVPAVVADGQTERWRERQEKAMMLAGKLAALAPPSTSTSTSTSIAQQGSASRDVSEESSTDDVSADYVTASQDEGQGQRQGQGQEQRGVQSRDGQEGTEAKGKTKRGLERRRRSKSEMKGVSLTSTPHTVTSSSSSSSSSSSDSATESLPLSPSSAHSGTSNRSRGGLKAKRDMPVKSEFRESKYLLSKYVT
jgi:hypothetical protein